MSDMHEPTPWFRPKTLGLGWTPITWQGWLITLVFAAVLGATIQLILPQGVGVSASIRWFAALRRDLGVPAPGLGIVGSVAAAGLEIGVFLVIAWTTSRTVRPLD